jgi:hypothetical protein
MVADLKGSREVAPVDFAIQSCEIVAGCLDARRKWTMQEIQYRIGWKPVGDRNVVLRSTVGGYAILPVGESWPTCAESGCDRKMSLYLQFDIGCGMGLRFENGSTLSIFQCLDHADPPEQRDTSNPERGHDCLPRNYWCHANYAIYFTLPDRQQQLPEREPHVRYSRLIFETESVVSAPPCRDSQIFRIGGSAFSNGTPGPWRCCCGSDMDFLCSVPGNLKFPRAGRSPSRRSGPRDPYFLFRGQPAWLFACTMRCKPRAVIAVRQY